MSAETFEAWATGAAAIATAIAIVIGGGWALWRYVLPAPFQPLWEIEVNPCWIRKIEDGRFRYTVEISFTNASVMAAEVDKVEFGIALPGESLSRLVTQSLNEGPLMHGTFSPRACRTISVGKLAEALHHTVLVGGQLYMRRRRLRWLGVAGWARWKMAVIRQVPVDAESLALYADSGKNVASDK